MVAHYTGGVGVVGSNPAAPTTYLIVLNLIHGILMTDLSLLDWRRKISNIYSDVRSKTNLENAWQEWLRKRKNLFYFHRESPISHLNKNNEIINFYPYNQKFLFFVNLKKIINSNTIELHIGKDGKARIFPYYRTVGLKKSLFTELIIYKFEGYAGGLFLPFKDLGCLNNENHYEGGRYLIDTMKGADLGVNKDNKLMLDFNFSYNPSCAYNNSWVCPILNNKNFVKIFIDAGEKKPNLNN